MHQGVCMLIALGGLCIAGMSYWCCHASTASMPSVWTPGWCVPRCKLHTLQWLALIAAHGAGGTQNLSVV